METKRLLLCDICARLPYNVRISFKDKVCKLRGVTLNGMVVLDSDKLITTNIENCLPYLFPLSSITLSQRKDIAAILNCNDPWDIEENVFHWSVGGGVESETFTLSIVDIEKLVDYFNQNHIDYKGFITKGLAKDASGLNIY